jgi:hypothetical protein
VNVALDEKARGSLALHVHMPVSLECHWTLRVFKRLHVNLWALGHAAMSKGKAGTFILRTASYEAL